MERLVGHEAAPDTGELAGQALELLEVLRGEGLEPLGAGRRQLEPDEPWPT